MLSLWLDVYFREVHLAIHNVRLEIDADGHVLQPALEQFVKRGLALRTKVVALVWCTREEACQWQHHHTAAPTAPSNAPTRPTA